MRVTMKLGPFNRKRYGDPWIAKVVKWTVGRAYELEFGSYIGDGSGGEVEIEADPGAVLRFGQKDLRRPDKSTRAWGIVGADGGVTEITKVEAREAWLALWARRRRACARSTTC